MRSSSRRICPYSTCGPGSISDRNGSSSGGLPWPGAVLRPLHAALARAAEQVEVAVAVPVDDERVAVMARDPQRLVAGLDLLGLRLELALALPLEQVERAGEVADDQVEVAVAVPIDREGPRADVLDPVSPSPGLP